MSTVSEISEKRRVMYRNQSVPTLKELVEYVGATNKTLMFDVRKPPSDHPYEESISQRIVEDIQKAGISPDKVVTKGVLFILVRIQVLCESVFLGN